MTNDSNAYCTALGIPVPRLEDARSSPDANYYSLLLVALLEGGAPLTLEEAALRFEEVGVAPAPEALASLKRCKPARPPIYRDGDHYSLDPHDDEAYLWAFRLGLRPARAVPLHVVRPDSGPPRTSDQRLTVPELDEAWREGIPNSWSAQRIAAAVLDAHDTALFPDDVLAFVRARSQANLLRADSAQYWHHGSAVRVRNDGCWELDRAHVALHSARDAVRERITVLRRWAAMRPDPAAIERNRRRIEGLRDPQGRGPVGATARRCARGGVISRRHVRPRAPQAANPDVDRALEAMTAPELRSFVRGVLDGLEDDQRAVIVDSIVTRAASGDAGWKPSRPSRRIVDEVRLFVGAARRIGHADPDDVSAYLREGSKVFLSGDHASARSVFEALLPPIAVADIDLGQHELVEEVLGIDARTCVAQYVTSVYTTTPLADRAEAVQNAIEQVDGVGTLLNPIKDMEDVSAGALPLRQTYSRRHAFREELTRAMETLGVSTVE